MKNLALVLFLFPTICSAGMKVTCFIGSSVTVVENVVDYGDDMMTYKLVVMGANGVKKYVRVPKNACIVEETK